MVRSNWNIVPLKTLVHGIQTKFLFVSYIIEKYINLLYVLLYFNFLYIYYILNKHKYICTCFFDDYENSTVIVYVEKKM